MSEPKNFEKSDVSQESQYDFPYHYIPSFENGHFSQHLYWSWGYAYLGALEFILSSILPKETFKSLLDIGCGDGCFLRKANSCFPEKYVKGIDSSKRAIYLARAMNPQLSFECVDVYERSQLIETYDIVTLIEVLEHIPIDETQTFVECCARYLNPKGTLLLTVPHKNTPVSTKHYQHFDSESLRYALNPVFEITEFIFLEKKSPVFSRLMKTLLANRLFILNQQYLLDVLFSIYRKHYLLCNEPESKRIFVRAVRR